MTASTMDNIRTWLTATYQNMRSLNREEINQVIELLQNLAEEAINIRSWKRD